MYSGRFLVKLEHRHSETTSDEKCYVFCSTRRFGRLKSEKPSHPITVNKLFLELVHHLAAASTAQQVVRVIGTRVENMRKSHISTPCGGESEKCRGPTTVRPLTARFCVGCRQPGPIQHMNCFVRQRLEFD